VAEALIELRQEITDASALTPVERRGSYQLKRDDLFAFGEATGCKARTLASLLLGARGVVGYGSRASTMVSRVAQAARFAGLPSRIHTATGPETSEMADAVSCGAHLVRHTPGYLTVLAARARKDAADRGWVCVPFGLECQAALDHTAAQTANLPRQIPRLVIAVGSGVALLGVLQGLRASGRLGEFPILGVQIHADPRRRLDHWYPYWSEHVSLSRTDLPFHSEAEPSTLEGVQLDPIYEAKCLPFLRAGDLFWVVACRRSALREDAT
jgi:hypothetical protein